MANTIYSTDIFLDATMTAFSKRLAPLKAFSTDFEADQGQAGSTISAGLVSAATAGGEFVGDYEIGDNVIGKVEVTLKHLFQPFEISMSDANKSSVAKLENLAEANAGALADSIFQVALAPVTVANYGAAGFTGGWDEIIEMGEVTHAGFTLNSVKTLAGKLADAPADGRALILDQAYEANLIPTSGQVIGSDAVTEGRTPRLMGLDVYGSNYIPDNSINLKGVALHKSAIAVASRTPIDLGKDKNAYYTYEIVEIPSLGINVVYKEWFSTKTGSLWGCYETLFGAAAGIKDAASLIVSA